MQMEESAQQGLTLPGYNYLGPGNSLNSGVPVNQLDAAAKTHDEKYHKITEYYKKTKNRKTFEQNIREADEEFLHEVSLIAPVTTYESFAKYLAQGGIGTKYLVENIVGVVYPRTEEDDTGENENMDAAPQNVSSIIGGGVMNKAHNHSFQFKKKFTVAIASTKATYDKTNSKVEYNTYVHSIPWQMIYLYMTDKEYADMTTVFHTARVKKVGIKITNLGNRTPFITATNSVNFANANSQTTIGIWENMELMCPIKVGNNIDAKTLYGQNLNELAEGKDKVPDHSTAQAKIIDNRIKYVFKLNEINKKFYLPPIIMESTILYNATNSIGPIYEKTYSPKDGTFHTDNDGFETTGSILRNCPPSNFMNVESASVSNQGYVRSTTKPYEKATIDNMTIGTIGSNAPKSFLGSLGVGIIPLLNKDGTLEDALLNLLIETFIDLECVSHGTNLLMSKHTIPQPNTNMASLSVNKHTWSNEYSISGIPLMET